MGKFYEKKSFFLNLSNTFILSRNITAENILFVSDNHDAAIKLVNLKKAKYLPSPGKSQGLEAHLSVTSYTAPEMINRVAVENAIAKAGDLWSLGVLLYFLLVGKTPFGSQRQDDLMRELLQEGEIPFPEEDWVGISGEAKDLVRQLLQKNAMRRCTCEEALAHDWFAEVRMIATIASVDDQDNEEKDSQEPGGGVAEEVQTGALKPSAGLLKTLSNIRRLNARRKFQRAVHVIIFLRRIDRILKEKRRKATNKGKRKL